MVAFTTTTFGACCLVVASILNLHRLLLRLQALEQSTPRVFRVAPSGIVGILGIGQAAAVACFVLGCVYLAIVHNGAPISNIADAMARVESEGRSSSSMFAGYMLETSVLCIFAIVLLGLLRYVPSRVSRSTVSVAESSTEVKMACLARTAYYNLAATVLSILVSSLDYKPDHPPADNTQIRTSYHLIEFYMADPEGLEVAATSTLGFYLDLAPVFCACWAVLGQSTAINAADELADARDSGWPGNEKQSSVC